MPYIQIKSTQTNMGIDFNLGEMQKIFKFNIMTFEFPKGVVDFY